MKTELIITNLGDGMMIIKDGKILAEKDHLDKRWHICRTDFSDVCYVMTAKPFKEKVDAEKCLNDFLSNQTKLHHQDYEVTDEVPEGANWDNPVLNLKQ